MFAGSLNFKHRSQEGYTVWLTLHRLTAPCHILFWGGYIICSHSL